MHEGEGTTRSTAPPEQGGRGAGSGGEQRGDSIGPYRLLERIGEGGFGTVWLAERREPFVQRVALKIIKPGMDSKAVIARFEQERQALAVMDHPNVAKVLDGGVTPAGRPYFVMEHVKGEPITEYCDRHKLTIRQRLELFIPVCEAVQHAHMKGIIHRDLKPSNILVAAAGGMSDVGSGMSDVKKSGAAAHPTSAIPHPTSLVKVIDFGVAKAISHALTDKTIFTETGQLIGTPEYMSPEQAEMGATDVDTRTDVYSLGVLLYELLTGALPFDPAALRSKGYNEIQRIIREVDPPRPSTRLSSLREHPVEPPTEVGGSRFGGVGSHDPPTSVGGSTGDPTGVSIAQHRRAALPDLIHELKRELEWIPLKALRKDRNERYRTPTDLADDVWNYLAGRPLVAGPEAASYRLRKYVRRNRGPVLAGAAVLLTILLGLVGTGIGLYMANRNFNTALAEGIAARAAKAEADAQRDRAQAVTAFLVSSLKAEDPSQSEGRPVTVIDAMTRALHRGDLSQQPATEAMLLRTLASILYDNGGSAQAVAPAERALTIERSLHAGDHRDLALSLRLVGEIRRARGDFAAASEILREALRMFERLDPGDSEDVAESLGVLAWALDSRGESVEAERLNARALAMRRRLHPGDDRSVADSLISQATVLCSIGRAEEAVALLEEASAMAGRLFSGDHPLVTSALSSLSFALWSCGRFVEAEAIGRRSLEMDRRLWHGDHPNVAWNLNNLGAIELSLAHPAEAEPLLREALAIRSRLLTPDHPSVLSTMANLARCLAMLGCLDEAETLVRAATEGAARVLPEGHKVRTRCEEVAAEVNAARRTKPADAGAQAVSGEG